MSGVGDKPAPSLNGAKVIIIAGKGDVGGRQDLVNPNNPFIRIGGLGGGKTMVGIAGGVWVGGEIVRAAVVVYPWIFLNCYNRIVLIVVRLREDVRLS